VVYGGVGVGGVNLCSVHTLKMCFGSGFFDGIMPSPPRREKYKNEKKYQRDYAKPEPKHILSRVGLWFMEELVLVGLIFAPYTLEWIRLWLLRWYNAESASSRKI
jgi:hypothetical protein